MCSDVLTKFSCKDCGGTQLVITHVWSLLNGEESESWREWGPLNDNHHWLYEYKEKVLNSQDEEVQRGDFGEYQENDSASEPEAYEYHEVATYRENDDFFVNCGDCDREIEFGWSEPDRRGLIWPVELSDFDPSLCWADPKYTDNWMRKGWLRIDHVQA